MKAGVYPGKCPFCDNTGEIGTIESPLVTICLCPTCHRCWEILGDRIDRLIRMKYASINGKVVEQPETKNEEMLCPICWRELGVDWHQWLLKCPDPICGYEKRIPGLSKEQREIKKAYLDLRSEVFATAGQHGEVPLELQTKYQKLQVQYNAIKKYDVGGI